MESLGIHFGVGGGSHMALRIVLAVIIGGGIGLAIGMVGRGGGGQCPLLCNPYVSTGLGVVVALLLASRLGAGEPVGHGANVLAPASEAEYRQLVGGTRGVVLVEFYTPYCASCRKQAVIIDALADRFAGRAVVATADADQMPAVAGELGVRGVPTMVIYRDGQAVEMLAGLTSEEDLAALIEKHLAASAGSGGEEAAAQEPPA